MEKKYKLKWKRRKYPPEVQQIPGLKFKKYLLLRILNVYLGRYLETNRLTTLSHKFKNNNNNNNKGKSIYFLMTRPHLPYLLKERVYSC